MNFEDSGQLSFQLPVCKKKEKTICRNVSVYRLCKVFSDYFLISGTPAFHAWPTFSPLT